jgi:hypothetical protein
MRGRRERRGEGEDVKEMRKRKAKKLGRRHGHPALYITLSPIDPKVELHQAERMTGNALP